MEAIFCLHPKLGDNSRQQCTTRNVTVAAPESHPPIMLAPRWRRSWCEKAAVSAVCRRPCRSDSIDTVQLFLRRQVQAKATGKSPAAAADSGFHLLHQAAGLRCLWSPTTCAPVLAALIARLPPNTRTHQQNRGSTRHSMYTPRFAAISPQSTWMRERGKDTGAGTGHLGWRSLMSPRPPCTAGQELLAEQQSHLGIKLCASAGPHTLSESRSPPARQPPPRLGNCR